MLPTIPHLSRVLMTSYATRWDLPSPHTHPHGGLSSMTRLVQTVDDGNSGITGCARQATSGKPNLPPSTPKVLKERLAESLF